MRLKVEVEIEIPDKADERYAQGMRLHIEYSIMAGIRWHAEELGANLKGFRWADDALPNQQVGEATT